MYEHLCVRTTVKDARPAGQDNIGKDDGEVEHVLGRKRDKRLQESVDYKSPGYNPRQISPEALAALRESLRVFGDLSGFVVNRRTGNVVCANQRRKALGAGILSHVEWSGHYDVELGVASERFRSKERHGLVILKSGMRFTVREVDWSEEFEKAANVTANNPQLQGEFTSGLRSVLNSIQENYPEEFSRLRYDALLAELDELEEPQDGGAEPDEVLDIPEDPVSELGVVYRLGRHGLFCGDCRDVEGNSNLFGGRRADMVFTDPPYNMDYRSKSLGGIKNDALSQAEFLRLILASTQAIQDNLRRGGSYYICMSGDDYPIVYNQLRKLGMRARLIIWVKPSAGLGAQDYRPRFETLLYGYAGKRSFRTWRGKRRESNVWDFDLDRNLIARKTDGGGMVLEVGGPEDELHIYLEKTVKGTVIHYDGATSDLWRFSRASGIYDHPTQKPVELIERALRNSSDRKHVIWDPFGGSGSTLIACERMARTCLMTELDPKYCDVIRRRWARYVHGEKCDWEALTR